MTHPVFRIVPVFEASPFALGRDVRGCGQVPRVQNCPAEFRRGRFGHWRRRGVRDPSGAAGALTPRSPRGPQPGDLGVCRACWRHIPAHTNSLLSSGFNLVINGLQKFLNICIRPQRFLSKHFPLLFSSLSSIPSYLLLPFSALRCPSH